MNIEIILCPIIQCIHQKTSNFLFKHNVEVLGILSDDVETDSVAPGENLKIRLKGIEEEEILPGFILCDLTNLCHSGRTFDAQVIKLLNSSSWLLEPKWLEFQCLLS